MADKVKVIQATSAYAIEYDINEFLRTIMEYTVVDIKYLYCERLIIAFIHYK